MKQRLFVFTLMILLLIPSLSFAVSEAGLVFLLIEPGSRSGGMGQAHVAQVDDAFAGYWNTGAMAFNTSPAQIALMHSNWLGEVFDDIYYEYLGANFFIPDVGNIGLNGVFLTYGEQDAYDEDANFTGTFSSWELALSATYGYRVSRNLGLGAAFKFIHSDLAPEGTGNTEEGLKGQGSTFAFDLGVKWIIFDIGSQSLAYGLNIQNFGPNIVYINEEQSDPIPLNWRMGLSYQPIRNNIIDLTINADMNKLLANREHHWYERIYKDWADQSSDDEWAEIIWGAGAEFRYMKILNVRTGYIYDRLGEIEGPSFGLGLSFERSGLVIGVDYAMQPGGDLQDYNHTFSAKVSF